MTPAEARAVSAAQRVGGQVVCNQGGWTHTEFRSGWEAARYLLELSEQDAAKPEVAALGKQIRASVTSDEDFARVLQALGQKLVFKPEEGEAFQSIQKTVQDGGDCDCHSRVMYALGRAGGLPVSLALLYTRHDRTCGDIACGSKAGEAHDPDHVLVAWMSRNGPVPLETTCAAGFGEDPVDAAARLGILREDLQGSEVYFMTPDWDSTPTIEVVSEETGSTNMGAMSGAGSSGTWPSVTDNFRAFTGALEGADLDFMYLDDHQPDGLVTTGNGNLIDPIALAMPLDWVNPDGSKASASDVEASWNAVKAAQDLKTEGGMVYRSLPGNVVRLTSAGIDALYTQTLHRFEDEVVQFFPGWSQLPADVQFSILSMSWAAGADVFAGFPKFRAAVNSGDWDTAAAESHLTGTGIDARNAANAQLILNAKQGGDPSVLIGVTVRGVTVGGGSGGGTGGTLGKVLGAGAAGAALLAWWHFSPDTFHAALSKAKELGRAGAALVPALPRRGFLRGR